MVNSNETIMARKGLFVYAELDYRIHFESILKRCSFWHIWDLFVRIICFRLEADFFVPLNIGGDEYGTNSSD